MKFCCKCGNEWAGAGQPGSKDECVKCSADLHVCANCRFYDVHKPCQCQINEIELVLNKERFNFCDEFQFIDRKEFAPKKSGASGARDAFEKLFKKQK
jgi:hypothetical protein